MASKNSWFSRQNILLAVAALAAIAAVSFMMLHWGDMMGRPKIKTVAFFQISNTVGVDASKPISPSNPPDPAAGRDTISDEFAGMTGKLFIVMYPNNAAMHPMIKFQDMQVRTRPPAWVKKLEKISDPARRALAMAAMRGPRAMRMWLRRVGAKTDQQQASQIAWKSYQTALRSLNQEQATGTFAPGHLQAVLDALAAFNKAPGDVFKDAQRQALAQDVFAAGMSYMHQLNAARKAARDQYIDAIYSSLTDDQKTALGTAADKFLSRFNG